MKDSSGITGSIVSANGLGCVALKLFVDTLAVEVSFVCHRLYIKISTVITADVDPQASLGQAKNKQDKLCILYFTTSLMLREENRATARACLFHSITHDSIHKYYTKWHKELRHVQRG